ncbi:MAG: metal ABC transporter ATP-binding protein [Acidobacteriota bacterium]
MSTPALDLKDVSVSLRGTPVLEGIQLRLQRGEFLGLIGPNGAGKTMLLKVILGLVRPDAGQVRVLGLPPDRARGQVAYVPQHVEFDRSFPICVQDVVLMGRHQRKKLLAPYRQHDRDRARDALRRVELSDLANRQIGELSGGQLKRVLIARALAVDARLLLLDEPMASLDTRMGEEMYGLLDALSRGMTLILVSHDIGVLSQHVSSVACLNRRLFHHGSREITREMLDATYGSGVNVVVHDHPHHLPAGTGHRGP